MGITERNEARCKEEGVLPLTLFGRVCSNVPWDFVKFGPLYRILLEIRIVRAVVCGSHEANPIKA